MIQGLVIIIIIGFIAGFIFERLRLPPLLGMLLAGVAAGPHAFNIIPTPIMEAGNDIRMAALVVILLKAGLGLEKKKLLSQGTSAFRLGVIPCSLEATVVALAAHYLLAWDWLPAWVLGWVVCAESPAVLVPMMLNLKARGLGVAKGIPDLVLAGGALSDVVAITLFGIVAGLAGRQTVAPASAALELPLQIIGGLLAGYLAARIVLLLLARFRLTESAIQDLLVVLVAAMGLVLAGMQLHFSGYLATMTMGFIVLNRNEVLARRVRSELERAWVVAEIFLFVLVGAAVDLRVMASAGPGGAGIIALGLILGRMPGIALSTWGTTLNRREKGFLCVGFTAKATVQAAIGALPLALGVPHGEVILAIAVTAIVLTAPLGAIGTAYFAPKLLEKGEVDPTKVVTKEKYRIMVAFDEQGGALRAVQEAARVARQIDATLVILHIDDIGDTRADAELKYLENRHLISDIQHDFVVSGGNPVEAIVESAENDKIDMIFIGKSDQPPLTRFLLGDTAREVVKRSTVPVVVVE